MFIAITTTTTKNADKYRKHKKKQIQQKFRLIKKKGKEGPVKACKFRKNLKGIRTFGNNNKTR